MRALKQFYQPLFDFALRRTEAGGGASARASVVGSAARRSPFLGREFMPKLEEGNFWIRATLPMSISLEQSAKYVGRMRADHPRLPERPSACDDAAPHAPRDHHGRLAARPPRRRHRRLRLLQHRALRAARAVRRVAARRDQGEADRRALASELDAGVPRRHLQLLADDQRQRRGGDVGRQGREHGQGRSAPTCASTRPRPTRSST